MSEMVERFEELYIPEPNTGCWLWIGPYDNRDGYGRFKHRSAYRWAYENAIGPVPSGLVLDHKCNVRACVNPQHLQPVTNAENVLKGEGVTARNMRKTHCDSGHELSGHNLIIRRQGWRACRECLRLGYKRYRTRP